MPELRKVTKDTAISVGVLLTVAALLVPLAGWAIHSTLGGAVDEARRRAKVDGSLAAFDQRMSRTEEQLDYLYEAMHRIEAHLGTVPTMQWWRQAWRMMNEQDGGRRDER